MSGDNKRYWFHAKTYGYGWTLPVTWEGWLVLVIYLILLLGAIRMLADTSSAVVYGYIAVITALLVLICWFKGERPRWRWGGRKDALCGRPKAAELSSCLSAIFNAVAPNKSLEPTGLRVKHSARTKSRTLATESRG